MNESPKGKFRMWQWSTVAVVFFAVVFFLNGLEWFTYLVNSLTKASAGLVMLYYGCRALLHKRTHELPDNLRDERENYLAIAAGIVIGCSMIG